MKKDQEKLNVIQEKRATFEQGNILTVLPHDERKELWKDIAKTLATKETNPSVIINITNKVVDAFHERFK